MSAVLERSRTSGPSTQKPMSNLSANYTAPAATQAPELLVVPLFRYVEVEATCALCVHGDSPSQSSFLESIQRVTVFPNLPGLLLAIDFPSRRSLRRARWLLIRETSVCISPREWSRRWGSTMVLYSAAARHPGARPLPSTCPPCRCRRRRRDLACTCVCSALFVTLSFATRAASTYRCHRTRNLQVTTCLYCFPPTHRTSPHHTPRLERQTPPSWPSLPPHYPQPPHGAHGGVSTSSCALSSVSPSLLLTYLSSYLCLTLS